MTQWFLVRHGETLWNRKGRFQGYTDTRLNKVGRWQAKRLAARLGSIPFAAAYSSDLSRAVETAEAILQGRSIPLHITPELRELSFGQWEGLTHQESEAGSPTLYAQLMTGDAAVAPPGGESLEVLIRRVGILQGHLSQAHLNEENILMVAHGGSLRALLVNLLHLPLNVFWQFQLASGEHLYTYSSF